MRILLVDDDCISCELTKTVLGLDCDVVLDGLSAIKSFIKAAKEEKPYDVVLLDIRLTFSGGIDGHGVLQQIRKLEELHSIPLGDGVKVIFLTAIKSSDYVFKAFREGADGILKKPINKIEFDELMQDLNSKADGTLKGECQ